jgi:excisionase family DNA binding protein
MSESRARALRIDQVCAQTGLGRTSVYNAIASGALTARKFGRATVVLASDLEAWLQALPAVRPANSRAGAAADETSR